MRESTEFTKDQIYKLRGLLDVKHDIRHELAELGSKLKQIDAEIAESLRQWRAEDGIHIPGVAKVKMVSAERRSFTEQAIREALISHRLASETIERIMNQAASTTHSRYVGFYPED